MKEKTVNEHLENIDTLLSLYSSINVAKQGSFNKIKNLEKNIKTIETNNVFNFDVTQIAVNNKTIYNLLDEFKQTLIDTLKTQIKDEKNKLEALEYYDYNNKI